MKNILKSAIIVLMICTLGVLVYFKVTFELQRKAEIEFGNRLIKKIEMYRLKKKTLPENKDWKLLAEIGFESSMKGTNPSYTKKGNDFEIIFLDCVDGPFVCWNTMNKKWVMSNPTLLQE